MRRALFIVGILIATQIAGNALASAQTIAAEQLLRQNKEQIALALTVPIAACVQRYDTAHAAFHGCIDWHSAVHGTWALVAYTAMTNDRRYEPLIHQTLTEQNLAEEAALLKENEAFENPYGRAWLLRLGLEYEHRYHNGRLQPIAEIAAASLLAHYQQNPPNPRSVEYNNAAWALINLVDYYEFIKEADQAGAVKKLIRTYFVDDQEGCDAEHDRDGFMAICTNWAWAASKVMTHEEFTQWAKAFIPIDKLPQPITDPLTAHDYGLNFSRAWGLWEVYLVTKQPQYLESYVKHFSAAFDTPDNWRGDYGTIGHWVPQFGLFALQALFGSPSR